MTIAEINLYIETENIKRKEEEKRNALLIYNHAYLVGIAVSAFNPISDGVKYPQIYEVFPEIFEREKPQQQDWRIAKERLLKFADAHNQKRGDTKI